MATTTKFDLDPRRPFYASVGATDLAVERVRDAVADVQKRVAVVSKDVQTRVAEVQRTVSDPKALREQAVSTVQTRAAGLRDGVQAVPSKVSTLVSDLVSGNVATVNEAYDDLTKRGESLVRRIRDQRSSQQAVAHAETTVAKAKTTRTQASKAAVATKTEAKAARTTTAKTAKKTASRAARETGKTASTAAKKTTTTARNRTAPATSSAKATVTAAQKTAASTVDAAVDAAQKVGD